MLSSLPGSRGSSQSYKNRIIKKIRTVGCSQHTVLKSKWHESSGQKCPFSHCKTFWGFVDLQVRNFWRAQWIAMGRECGVLIWKVHIWWDLFHCIFLGKKLSSWEWTQQIFLTTEKSVFVLCRIQNILMASLAASYPAGDVLGKP